MKLKHSIMAAALVSSFATAAAAQTGTITVDGVKIHYNYEEGNRRSPAQASLLFFACSYERLQSVRAAQIDEMTTFMILTHERDNLPRPHRHGRPIEGYTERHSYLSHDEKLYPLDTREQIAFVIQGIQSGAIKAYENIRAFDPKRLVKEGRHICSPAA